MKSCKLQMQRELLSRQVITFQKLKSRATSITRANKSNFAVRSFPPQQKQLGILEEKEINVSKMETLNGHILEDKDMQPLLPQKRQPVSV
ncbi:hypothetical protein SLE2022_322430 [Rubroshorea leprosula]